MKQLKSRQVCLFIIAFFPILKIFMLPSILAKHAFEDMWISAIINIALEFISLVLILRACRLAKCNFYQLLENNLGKFGAKILLLLYFAFFMLKTIIPLNEQKDYIVLTLYTLMPNKLYFLPTFVLIFYFCTKPLRVVGRASDLLWFFTIIGLALLVALAIPNANLEAILPVGAQGLKNILVGSYLSFNWFGDCVYLLFFIGEFVCTKKDTVKIILSFLLASLLIVVFMILFYCVFTSIAFRQRFALTEISKYTAVINNIGRFDYIGIVFILFSNIFALCLPMFFSCKILNYVFSINNKWISPLIVVLIQALILIVFTQYYAGIEKFIINYVSAFFMIMAYVLPAFTLFLTSKGDKYETNTQS